MSCIRAAFVFFFCASIGLAADVVTLSEKKITGDLTSIDAKQVVVQSKDGPVRVSVEKEVRLIDLVPPPASANPPAGTLVELTDGSQLFCKPETGIAIDGNRVKLTLLETNLQLDLPVTALSYALKLKCLHDANMNVREHAEWKTCLQARKNHDMVCIWRESKVKNSEGKEETVWRLNNPDGTFADKGEGTTLEFTTKSGVQRKLNFNAKLTQAWIFANKPDPAAPVQLCKLTDKDQNVLVVAKIEAQPNMPFRITTVSGAKLTYPRDQVCRLDFSKGRLEYLSDIEPIVEKPEPGADRWDRYRFFKEEDKRNKNLDGGILKIDGKEYPKGLNLPAPTNLLYKLNGEFKTFSCVIGVDDAVPGNSQVEVVIEGDNGRKLWSAKVSRKGIAFEGRKPEEMKKSETVRLNIKDVQALRIRVRSVGLLDYGNHVDLADVKINK